MMILVVGLFSRIVDPSMFAGRSRPSSDAPVVPKFDHGTASHIIVIILFERVHGLGRRD